MTSSRHGDEKQAADERSAKKSATPDGSRERREAERPGSERCKAERGVTRITDDNDPIASALRRLYNDAATEPLPEDLSMLLSRLEAAEKDA